MNASTSKENILKKIRKALSESTPLPFPASEGNQSVFRQPTDDLEVMFAEAFTALQGKFSFCLDAADLQQQLQQLMQQKGWKNIVCKEPALQGLLGGAGEYTDLASCDASITSCECLVARTGTIVLSAAKESGRTTSVYAPVHICLATTDQLVYDIRDGLKLLKDKYGSALPSLISFASGPSRTADIEKTLVVGVHGPKEVYVFLADKF
jgi:L-lactate dehydrogenase complex protein LldG